MLSKLANCPQEYSYWDNNQRNKTCFLFSFTVGAISCHTCAAAFIVSAWTWTSSTQSVPLLIIETERQYWNTCILMNNKMSVSTTLLQQECWKEKNVLASPLLRNLLGLASGSPWASPNLWLSMTCRRDLEPLSMSQLSFFLQVFKVWLSMYTGSHRSLVGRSLTLGLRLVIWWSLPPLPPLAMGSIKTT